MRDRRGWLRRRRGRPGRRTGVQLSRSPPHWPGEAETRLDHASFYDHDQTLHDDDHARLEHHDEPNFDHDDDPEIGQIAGRRVAASNLMTLGVSVQNVQCANRTQQLRGEVLLRSCKH